MCKNLQVRLFHAHLVVSLSAFISLKSDNYGLAIHYIDTCPNKNKTEPQRNFIWILYISLPNFKLCLRNFKHRICEKLFQNNKERVGNGCYMSVSKKPRKQEHMTEHRKENENWIPVLRKDNMLKKQLPSNKCYGISP